MSATAPILVTGAAGNLGAVGRQVVELLRQNDLPVRALVRRDDERAKHLQEIGAEVVIGDLTNPQDVVRILNGVKRIYFGLSVSPQYLEATMTMAAAAKQQGGIEILVNMSQMTVSELDMAQPQSFAKVSAQQRSQYLAEQALNWSTLPVTHIRPTVFMNHPFFSEWASESITADGTLRLPFGTAKTSPIATEDVACAIATILQDPTKHVGNVYMLTGPSSLNGDELAQEYSKGLNRKVRYVPFDLEAFKKDLTTKNLPSHLSDHISTMASLHADNRYDRAQKTDFTKLTGRQPLTVSEFVAKHAEDIFHIKC